MFPRKSVSAVREAFESLGWKSPKTFSWVSSVWATFMSYSYRPRHVNVRPPSIRSTSVAVHALRAEELKVLLAEVIADRAHHPHLREEARCEREVHGRSAQDPLPLSERGADACRAIEPTTVRATAGLSTRSGGRGSTRPATKAPPTLESADKPCALAVSADCRLRIHIRLPHGGAGGARRVGRVALRAAVRLGQRVRRPARPPGQARSGLRPGGAGTCPMARAPRPGTNRCSPRRW